MSGRVKDLGREGRLDAELRAAGLKLVVVDFYATWCGPCNRIAPVFKDLSTKYPNVVFVKVDVDLCKNTAKDHSVSSMPTFLFFRNGVKIDKLSGADPKVLETKIQKYSTPTSAATAPKSAATAPKSPAVTSTSRQLPAKTPTVGQRATLTATGCLSAAAKVAGKSCGLSPRPSPRCVNGVCKR